MPASVIPAFLLYCVISCITPGPANLCSLSASLRYGTRAALRQWRGLIAGFFIDSMLAALLSRLLGEALGTYARWLSWLGAAYILWLAWGMLRSAGTDPAEDARQPSFRSGLLVNLTNGKVILFCITTLSAFVLPYTTAWRCFWCSWAPAATSCGSSRARSSRCSSPVIRRPSTSSWPPPLRSAR